LRATPPDNANDLSQHLEGLLGNNGKWFVIAGKQFALTVANFL